MARNFDTVPWDRSRRNYLKYHKAETADRLRKVFEQLVFNDDFWTGDVYMDDSLARFEEKATAEFAQGIAERIIESQEDTIKRSAVRVVLAARAALVHDNIALADQIIETQREGTSESRYEAQMERLLVTMRCPEAAEANQHLFAALARNARTNVSLLANDWIDHRWLYEGPSTEILRATLETIENLRDSGMAGLESRLEQILAMAFRLDDMSSVDYLLTSYPELTNSYQRVLPLAAFLRSNGLSAALTSARATIIEHAEFFEQLNLGATLLLEALADRNRTLAIVGSSPCELGSGNGPRIDSHDIVTRFNSFNTSDLFAPDYGRKSTIHVRRLSPLQDKLSARCELAVIRRADLQYRVRWPSGGAWRDALIALRHGIQLGALPIGFESGLYKELRTQPSAGLIFCALAHTVRGELNKESCFGFSFIDQIAPGGSAHYFAQRPPKTFKHYWHKEKKVYKQLLAAGSGESQVDLLNPLGGTDLRFAAPSARPDRRF